ncbi:MAG TPA: VOC family protein [Bryobacteraceae bacterium]|nr:VOC family protein [Bryobacteraceae bacterium]
MAKHSGSPVIPGIQYRDAARAIDWLCQVFGFEKHKVIPGPNNSIMHSELTLGTGMIMVGTINETRGAATAGINLTVSDADAVCARAKQQGAAIVVDIADKPFGGRGFTCRDPEGHLWDVNTYDPWAAD